jgi:hypothetical protein
MANGCADWLGSQTNLPGAQWDISGTPQPWKEGDPCPNSCYDLRAGSLVATGSGGLQGCGNGTRARDNFQIAGLPSGSPALSFQAELWVSGTIDGSGAITAGVAEGFSTQNQKLWTVGPVSDKVVFSLSHAPGESFQLEIGLQAQGYDHEDGTIQASATLHFSGLPPGASVISCQNYDLPVPTNSSTWGGVRARYR